MATTEQRTGFRLPWATEPRSETAPEASEELDPTGAASEAGDGTPAAGAHDAPQPTAGDPTDPRLAVLAGLAGDATDAGPTSATATVPEAPAPAAARSRRDNPLVAGLVRAMRDAAQSARDESTTRFGETVKARIETIQAEGTGAATELRHVADTDVAGIREWSKAEVARIREETDARIADRKHRLDVELEDHAARIDHRVERVHAAVSAFEAEMERFFERLLAEDDPARLAGLAEQLPEPPAFDDDASVDAWASRPTTLDGPEAASIDDAAVGEPAAAGDPAAAAADTPAEGGEPEALAAVATDPETGPAVLEAEDAAAAEAAAFVDLPDDASWDDGSTNVADDVTVAEVDPAEEARVAERLAAFASEQDAPPATTTSRISVVGLVSVASIAGFKRAIGRLPGVTGVAVASGPAGDFIFTVEHLDSTDPRALVAALDGFRASITGDADGVLSVTASEPDPAS